jgi:ABC-type uncharacterized transport system ATPase component
VRRARRRRAAAPTCMSAPAPLPGLYLRWEDVVYDVSLPRDIVASAHTTGADDGLPPLTKRVLHRVSGQLRQGGLLAVMGPSGSGKTSLIKILAGRRAPTSGALLVNGAPLSPVPFRNASGFVAQHTVFLDTLTVRRLACVRALRCAALRAKRLYARSYNKDRGASVRVLTITLAARAATRCGRRSCAPPCCAWSAP